MSEHKVTAVFRGIGDVVTQRDFVQTRHRSALHAAERGGWVQLPCRVLSSRCSGRGVG